MHFLRNALCGPKVEPRPSSLMSRLNESLWTLVIASATAFTGYAMVIIASRIERQRQERHAERFGEPNPKR
jgi:ABC-type spermidine/putrescine transport system permease subunit II